MIDALPNLPLPSLPLLAQQSSNAALVTFVLYILAVLGLAACANRLLKNKNFVSEYFLGSRSLGTWAFALTFAATSSSGGSFTGFPSRIYSHGWILALWIGCYMVVPICQMGLMGKRINHVARIAGSITIPDVLRDRFERASLGLLAMGLIVFFMAFNLVAQFKAGSLILETLLDDVAPFHAAADGLGRWNQSAGFLADVRPEYLLCLLMFGICVIAYTTWGGFHAVVWTDVMQGVVMVSGVLIMLPLAIQQAGGLASATRELAEMTPPLAGTATLELPATATEPQLLRAGTWVTLPAGEADEPRLFRLAESARFPAGQSRAEGVRVLEITTPNDIRRVTGDWSPAQHDAAERVVAADVPTGQHGPYGGKGVYVTGPGPDAKSADGFLPLSLAVSFFFMWSISGAGQPHNMVRLMSFNNTRTLRRAIFTVSIYYTLIYFPLVIIFCCARVIMPGMETESDAIMPRMAVTLTMNIGQGWLAGLLVAAPFAAVMSTVDSFLLMISSAVVRDVYQRNLNPDATERTIRRLSYLMTLLVGTGAMLGAVNPPQFLQDIIIYTGSGLSASFLAPMLYALYWPRLNVPGLMAGMLSGFFAHLSLYVAGYFINGRFFLPYQILNFDPIIPGLLVSFVMGYVVTRLTPPPPANASASTFTSARPATGPAMMDERYRIDDPRALLSPALVLFREVLVANIREMIRMAGSPARLRPHCKTHKMAEVTRIELELGITRHKCATFAEAEMLAGAGIRDILLAYNLVGPNIARAVQFLQRYPDVTFAVTGDDPRPLVELAQAVHAVGRSIDVLLDIDSGQHRTGVPISPAARDLYRLLAETPGLAPGGLHVYDGHIHQAPLAERQAAVNGNWTKVLAFRDDLRNSGWPVPRIVVGGTPTFPAFVGKDDPTIELSPGTCVLHDVGYGEQFVELAFTPAALLLTRVVSRPTPDRLTLDLGYKAVASDPPAGRRVHFPDLPDARQVLQNEEHLVLESERANEFSPGDVLLAIPRHVCPTVALHRSAIVIADGQVAGEWNVIARDRQLTI